MCGILGGVNIQITPDVLETIRHRGPDNQSIHHISLGGNDVYMAHTRLSIVDLSEAGNQPMISDDGNYVLIFNGEIYNHLELRKILNHRQFKGHSDTETLLYLLAEYGETCIEKLNGIFAFAFLDKLKNQLILCRDPYGVKPLYYFRNGNQMMFASEIRPIKRCFELNLDHNSLGILLSLRYLPSPYTLFNDVYKLRPGHYSKIDLNQLVVNEIPYITSAPKYNQMSLDDAAGTYGIKLQKAVERQLMGDVDMGILLSGGVDSALVGGIASKNYPKRLKAFTVGFDSQYKVNELELASETAKYFGMEHFKVKMDVKNFFETFAECSRIVEEPLATTSFIPMYYLAKLASEHVKVVLTGQGADEPLGGYGRYQGEILHNKYPRALFKLMDGAIRMSGIKNEALIRGGRSLAISDDVKRFMYEYCLFTPDEVFRMTGTDYSQSVYSLIAYYYRLATNQYQTSTDKMMSIDLHMDLADDLLLYTDKITMNFSLECRVPMLDLELVKYLQSLPTAYKVQRKRTKIVHKLFAEKWLPESFVNRPKFGFQSPTDIWFREKADFVEDTLLNGKLVDLISKKEIHTLLQMHKKGYNKEKQIFLLLSINEWLKLNS